ncbi:peptide ABC transporter substrate-binding protein [Fictibacillus sp. NRS-1165]|uniref:peptide ABC transporter substrate-binding protein n=1 Tax=Fictibacillus sp. NRS-1165 TaxID=3144463 RepID=UPI003D22F675
MSITWKKQFAGLLVFILILSVLSACSGGSKTSSTEGVKQEITLNALSEPPSLDPALATDTTSGWILDHLYEGLYMKNKSGDSVKGLAKDVKVSADKKVYTFKLRDDAKWSDGDPVTAGDFEYAWKHVLDPKTGSSFAFYMYYIKGAEAYNKGKGSAADVGVKALDDKTLQVELAAPTSFIEKLLSFWVYYPVKKEAAEGNKNWAGEAKDYVSNGPYKLTEWKHNRSVAIEKNKNYYGKDDVKMEKVTWKMVNDATTYYQMYKSGELDLIQTLPSDVIAQEKDNKEYKVTPYFGTYMYMFNIGKEPFNNEKVREAFNLAIDRKMITDKITQAGEKPAMGFVPYGAEVNGKDFRKEHEKYFTEDVKKAKQLIKEAMKEEGWSKFPETELTYNTLESHKKTAEAVQEMLKKNLGVDVKLTNQEWKTYLDTTKQKNFQMARMGWIGIYVDPTPILDYYLGDSPNNRTNWVNPKYDQLLAQSKKEQNEGKRMELLHQAEDVLMKDLPFLPVYYYSNNYLTSKKFKGIVYPVNRYPYVRWAEKVSE